MIFVVAGVIVALVALVGVLLALRERDQRAFAAERREWAAERRELNQRIQAPEIATVQAIDVTRDGPAYISPDDDTGFWEEHMARTADA